MKKRYIITFSVLFSCFTGMFAQKSANEILNTVKDRLTVSGYVQAGYEATTGDNSKNEFLLRRATLTVEGQITSQWSAVFQYAFAGKGNILNCYTQYDFRPEFSVRLGQFITPFTIDNQLSPTSIELISTQSLATSYLVGGTSADPAYGGHSGRDIGLMFLGSVLNKRLDYAFAIQNGQGINIKDGNTQKDIVGKLDFHVLPAWTLSGSFIKGKGHAVGSSPYTGIVEGEDYKRNRWSLGTTLNFNKVNIRAEYLAGKDKDTKSQGAYGLVCYEILPKLEIIGSVDYFDRNKDAKSRQTNYIGGLQYWFYPKCRLATQYSYQTEKHGDNTHLIQAQIQVQF
ncbi:MAG: porin [Bacteroides sp.]|nr:OprO/OprP family phosphate-selective porin [Bacteroides sp.]MDD2645151.1 porin [Bacteroides sp.]MDD4719699.1 porin [Bacteroides sp.]